MLIWSVPCWVDVAIWEPVAIVGGAVYIYIPDVRPTAAWLSDVSDEGGGRPGVRREGIGGPTGRPLPNPNGGRQSPAAAALLKSIVSLDSFMPLLKLHEFPVLPWAQYLVMHIFCTFRSRGFYKFDGNTVQLLRIN